MVTLHRRLGLGRAGSLSRACGAPVGSACWAAAGPAPSEAFICASSFSTSEVEASCSSSRVMSSLVVPVASSKAPLASSSSIAPARACICMVLSSAR